jgi:hypothetical protein
VSENVTFLSWTLTQNEKNWLSTKKLSSFPAQDIALVARAKTRVIPIKAAKPALCAAQIRVLGDPANHFGLR